MKMKISICLVLMVSLMPVLLSSDGKETTGGTPLPTTPAAPVTVLTDAEALDQVQKMH
jgi:hypothetical protein